MDDPEPEPNTVIFILCYLLFMILSFLVKLSSSAVAEVNDKKFRQLAEDGDKSSKRLINLIDRRPRPADISGVSMSIFSMLALACALLCYLPQYAYNGVLSENYSSTSQWLKSVLLPAFIITVIAAGLFAVVGVLIPRKIGKQNCEKCALSLSGVLIFMKYLFFIIIWPASFITRLIVKSFGGDPHLDETPVTESGILSMVDEGEETGVLEESQKEMINNIFEFDDLAAGDVMTHRTDIIAVEEEENLGEVISKAIDEGCSRIPVYHNELDNIKGILYVKDLLKFVGAAVPDDITPKDLMREAMFVPETKKCRELFSEMTEKHLQMVVVADEYGGVAGIVTIEDLIESIMGNIQDEFDDEEEDFQKIGENIFNIDGTSDVDEVEELLGIKFPQGEYDTVAGYIMSVLGRIPDSDEHPTVEYNGYSFRIDEMEDRRIVRIRVERLPEDTEE